MPHTQGEWQLTRCDGNQYVVMTSPNAAHGVIATVHDMGDETEANAKLIEQSPKLLASCQSLLPLDAFCLKMDIA